MELPKRFLSHRASKIAPKRPHHIEMDSHLQLTRERKLHPYSINMQRSTCHSQITKTRIMDQSTPSKGSILILALPSLVIFVLGSLSISKDYLKWKIYVQDQRLLDECVALRTAHWIQHYLALKSSNQRVHLIRQTIQTTRLINPSLEPDLQLLLGSEAIYRNIKIGSWKSLQLSWLLPNLCNSNHSYPIFPLPQLPFKTPIPTYDSIGLMPLVKRKTESFKIGRRKLELQSQSRIEINESTWKAEWTN